MPEPNANMQASAWTEQELADAAGGMRRGAHWLLFAIALFFVVALTWAAYFEIDEVVHAEGRVITARQTQYVQNLEGGIIAQILVREGDVVEKDQVLFRIDSTRFAADFKESTQASLALKAKIARLAAESKGMQLSMPAEVTRAAPALGDAESALYRARQLDLSNRVALLKEQWVQRQQELVELKSRAGHLAETRSLIEREIRITAPLVKQGVVSEVELLRLQREAARLLAELEGARLAVPRVEAAIEESKKRVDDSSLAFRSAAQTDLAEARTALERLSQTIPALEDRVARAEARAPVKGVVKTIANKTVGGVVQAGSPLAEIVATEDALLFEARIRPSDIAFVAVGQQAVVKLSAYDYAIFGGLEAQVTHISADSIQPQSQSMPAEAYFVAHVRAERAGFDARGKTLPVAPGMTGVADVVTGRRTVLHYLLKPLNRARERAFGER